MKRPAFPQINGIVTAMPTAIAVIYLALVWLPGYRAITAVQNQAESQRQFVVQAAGLPTTLAGRQRELDAAEAAVARWEKAAPRKRRLSEYFEKLNVMAGEAGLAIARFRPQPVVVHEKIDEIPLVIDCLGGFAHVYEFLRSVERLPATIWIESIKIENAKKNAKNVACRVNLVGFIAAGAPAGPSGGVAPSTTIKAGASARPSWQQIVHWMENDPRTAIALPLVKTRDPFQPPQSVVSQR